MGYPEGIPPPPPGGGGGGGEARVVPVRLFIKIKNPTVYHSGVVVLLIPFLALTLLHNHNLPNYQLLLLADILRTVDLFAVVRILFY